MDEWLEQLPFELWDSDAELARDQALDENFIISWAIEETFPFAFEWEDVYGTFATVDGELLRYILHTKIPLEKLIRYELASRGFDENHRWCGFERAEEI